jgi:hypothetical protein
VGHPELLTNAAFEENPPRVTGALLAGNAFAARCAIFELRRYRLKWNAPREGAGIVVVRIPAVRGGTARGWSRVVRATVRVALPAGVAVAGYLLMNADPARADDRPGDSLLSAVTSAVKDAGHAARPTGSHLPAVTSTVKDAGHAARPTGSHPPAVRNLVKIAGHAALPVTAPLGHLGGSARTSASPLEALHDKPGRLARHGHSVHRAHRAEAGGSNPRRAVSREGATARPEPHRMPSAVENRGGRAEAGTAPAPIVAPGLAVAVRAPSRLVESLLPALGCAPRVTCELVGTVVTTVDHAADRLLVPVVVTTVDVAANWILVPVTGAIGSSLSPAPSSPGRAAPRAPLRPAGPVVPAPEPTPVATIPGRHIIVTAMTGGTPAAAPDPPPAGPAPQLDTRSPRQGRAPGLLPAAHDFATAGHGTTPAPAPWPTSYVGMVSACVSAGTDTAPGSWATTSGGWLPALARAGTATADSEHRFGRRPTSAAPPG